MGIYLGDNKIADRLPSQPGNGGKYLFTDGTNTSWRDTPTRSIGEIVTSAIPIIDAGLKLLDGFEIVGGGIYDDFIIFASQLRETNPNLFVTEEQWQQLVSDYGVCGKFVYREASGDTPVVVRLPKITGFIEGTTDVTVLGDLVEAGLPNITGNIYAWNHGDGAFQITSQTQASSGEAMGYQSAYVNFDASRSSSIYGNSTIVQPQAIKVLYYIVIAETTKLDIQIDIDKVATDLNYKANRNLDNVPDSKGILMETYQNGTSWYRIYSDGWCEQGGFAYAPHGSQTVSFLKVYRDTNYNAVATIDGFWNPGAAGVNGVGVVGKATDYMVIAGGEAASNADWRTAGYLAES